VIHDLAEKLGREPDPEELESELRRDKGYRRKKIAIQKKVVKANVYKENIHSGDSDNSGGGKDLEDLSEESPRSQNRERRVVTLGKEDQQQASHTHESLASLHQELAEQKAFKEATIAKAAATAKEASGTANNKTNCRNVSISDR
jgi:hypothetical protein